MFSGLVTVYGKKLPVHLLSKRTAMETTKLLHSEFIDILFDDRNKDYGAYDLRRRYNKRVRTAVAGMAAIVLLIVGGYTISTRLMASGRETPELKRIITETKLMEIPDEKPVVHTPPPKVEAPALSKPEIKYVTPKIEKDDKVNPDDELVKNDDLKKNAISTRDNLNGDPNGSDNGVPEGVTGGSNVVEAPKAVEKEVIPSFVEIMPEYPGGEAALMRFLHDNIRYPHVASENGIEGTVTIKFVVRQDGKVSDPEIVGAQKGGGLGEEALRVIRKMPKWRPGKQNGREVAVYYNLPIRFKLDNQN